VENKDIAPLEYLPLNENDLPDNMVAVAVYVQEGEPSHAAILIRYEGETLSLHYLKNILLESPVDDTKDGILILIKELSFIPSFLLPSFVAHCELIAEHAKPKYGFFYDPRSFYDESGVFKNPGDFPEYMTCVGFCLTVLQSYLNPEEYLYYADWDKKSYDLEPDYLWYQMESIKRNYPNLKPEDLLESIRRIRPIEYFSGAYGPNRPVRKTFTDKISRQILIEIKKLVA
jgi:hypothetical protein